MATRPWYGNGPEFRIDWGGRTWTLRPDAAKPGLYAGGRGPLLGLDGVAVCGRTDHTAFTGVTLVEYACRFDHVEAVYRPAGWGELTLRARWTPAGSDEALDLLVELSARSVGELRSVEILTLNHLDVAASTCNSPSSRTILPRDKRGALLAHDGREGNPADWVIEPPPRNGELPPWTALCPALSDDAYVALSHPDDVSRQIVDTSGLAVRYALFGYDLERGVVLRGRLRSLWCPAAGAGAIAAEALGRLRREPLPLTT